jgi:PIN domain nuclease of toxin-antitoxin system
VKLLLDTHAFIWLNEESRQLSDTVKALYRTKENEIYLSIASAWEIQIKAQLGKLDLKMPIKELIHKNIEENQIYLLSINLSHIDYLERLPAYHKDPFDRIIIAQALVENLTIVSIDSAFDDYAVSVIW